jgi:hypothetical protein
MRARQRQGTEQDQRAQPRRRGRAARRGAGSQGLGRGTIIAGILTILVAAGGLFWASTHQTSGGPTPTAVSLAPAIDGIKCLGREQLVYHIHQRIDLYDQGKRMPIPALIGIPNDGKTPTCYYWIHVHQLDDIIHVESPTAKTYTLGDFFDVWNGTKNSTVPRGYSFLTHLEAASPSQITVFYNGKRWKSGYRSVPLTEHALITVEIGKPVIPPRPAPNWKKLGL